MIGKGESGVDIKNIENIDFGSLSSEEAKELGFNVLFQEEDGTFDWIFSLKLLKNRSLLKFVIKVIALICVLIAVVFIIVVRDPGLLLMILGILVLCFAGGSLIAVFATWVVNAMYKGNYLLVYQLNDRQLLFSQTSDQAQITKIISVASAAVNAAGNNLGGAIAGAGLAMSPNAYSSDFSKVKAVRGNKKDNLIWVNSFFQYQMVYVPDSFYDFVWDYVTQRCPKAKIKKR